MPPQQWRFELELAKDLGKYGRTKVNLIAAFFEDYIDIIPIGTSRELPGNVDEAQAYAIDWTSTFLLDPLGLRGAKIDLRALVQFSRIADPLTGEVRDLRSFTDRMLELSYRHDVPRSNWAYGANMNYSHITQSFRLN